MVAHTRGDLVEYLGFTYHTIIFFNALIANAIRFIDYDIIESLEQF
jgi:hypothetical protein